MAGTLEFAIHTWWTSDWICPFLLADIVIRRPVGCVLPQNPLEGGVAGLFPGLISSRLSMPAGRMYFYGLTCGLQPDHSTIAAFVSSVKDEILPLFRDVLLV